MRDTADVKILQFSAWAEIYEVFGDGEDYAWAMYSKDQVADDGLRGEKQLKDIFEPSELIERMLTDADEDIRIKDIPERMQLRYGFAADTPLTDIEVEEEADWIARTLAPFKSVDYTLLSDAVKHIVRFLSQEFLEVPFIATHRQDYFVHLDREVNRLVDVLSKDDLWEIYDLDFKFRSFLERRLALRSTIDRVDIHDDYLEDQLRKADKIEHVNDLMDYVHLHYGAEIAQSKRGQGRRRPNKHSLYEICKKSPVSEFAKKFGIRAHEFGVNFSDGTRQYFPDDLHEHAEEMAVKFVSASFSSPQLVLKAAKSMIAQQISFDPQVRKALRLYYEYNSSVTVIPTDSGIARIDEYHPYYPFKYLRRKPFRDFFDGQFVEILKSEEEGLTKVAIHLDDEDRFFRSFSEAYTSDNYSEFAQQWNEHRIQILKNALTEWLYPMAEKWVKEKLRADAEDWIAKKCQASLQRKLEVGPYRSPQMDHDVLPRVLAVSWGAGEIKKDPVVCIFLDGLGRLSEYLKLDDIKDEENREQFLRIIDKRQPDIIAVGGYNIQTRKLFEEVQLLAEETHRKYGDQIAVSYVNDEAARLYRESKRGSEEFPELPPIMRYCISLARMLQNPIMEYAALGRDILSIQHHTLQRLLPEERLMTALERALINTVNSVGVDINEAVDFTSKSYTLQYVSGLGPRKVQSLIKRITSTGGYLESRADLITKRIATRTIFMNCASFLRIRPNLDVLDDTRIHPQDYELARKMAADAMEIDEEDLRDYDSASQHVAELMKNEPDKLNDLILDDYADELERRFHTPKRMILNAIKKELQGPYQDERRPFAALSEDDIFTMLTGETDETLCPGMIIPVEVARIRDRMAFCRLDSGIEGVIGITKMSDQKIRDPSEVMSVGDTIQCMVLSVNKERFMVDLSCHPYDLNVRHDEFVKSRRDRAYDAYEEERERNKQVARQQARQMSNRVIKHPLFKSLKGREAEAYLASKSIGEAVIRPSSRGNDHIAITWKVYDNIYQHIDVLEFEKENDYAVGRILKIGDATYTDLDELIVSHVDAAARKVEEMLSHPKFKTGSLKSLNDFLEATTKANPKQSAYGFCLNPEKPGSFFLAFKLNAQANPHQWVVKVIPGAFKLGTATYPDVISLINGFKLMQQSRNKHASGSHSRDSRRSSHQQQPSSQHRSSGSGQSSRYSSGSNGASGRHHSRR
ncbi:transcription elongation factor Spt6 [Basidiobolus meristosporus CBS 931.73]|uniref:Transcription elongation factor Spt6 n=1 Tax=Basidiobolus meristosporus CBS 931.73 TaxID=1314790 RepID=A0A1Y1XUX1_9FUNG|nr:transcription elongation factor Spt6 [Basidiobolus meristosporus CBS 931.73]|eukprot:ORX89548.1 transcription elongation factor Spt6 [Basidiobolus meristosporus CBS 931.73]